ncbi:fimbrial protein [Stenotrophomonas koreensis]|uniref:Fimbrial protein n=1 Tax=Stenotrophomonas koreensis TaxID=266128 RepID=A0A0R0BU98_9GAMM|nr:pilin [Stenotrophomonas koreensis]KRG60729.1 fimbrial protein [Stenotrophomonas koreensis]
MKKQQGFTLIELMIVVAIIAILAAIALPAYQDYVARSQVSEGATLASGAKTAVAEQYANTGALTGIDNTAAGLAPAGSITGKYVSGVTVANGIITVAFNKTDTSAKIKSGALVYTPTDRGGSIEWACNGSGTTIADKYLPSACR